MERSDFGSPAAVGANSPGAGRQAGLRARPLVAVVVGLVVLGWLVLGFRQFLREPVYFDDSFISFHYARSLAEGHGLVFNAEDGPIEGFTNLGWVLVLAGLAKGGLAPETAARVLGLLCFALVLVLHWRVLTKLAPRALAALGGAALVGTLVIPYGLAAMAGTGLETPAMSMLAVALAALLLNEQKEKGLGTSRIVLITVLAFSAILTRLDGGLFVGAFGAVLLARSAVTSGPLRVRASRAFRTGLALLPTAALLGLLLVWKLWYFGEILPNTYYAKSADMPNWQVGWRYWQAFLKNSPQLYLLAPLALLATWRGRGAWAARYVAVALVLYVVYCAKVGGDFMYYRFAFEAYPLLTLGALIGLVRLAELLRPPAVHGPLIAGLCAASLWLSAGSPVSAHRYGMQSMAQMNGFVITGRQVGTRLREELPPDTRIATTLAGTIPYDSRLFTIDQWGINDRAVARQAKTPVTTRGHVKRASEAYLRARGVNLVVNHPAICDCARLCDDGMPNVYLKLTPTRCLRMRYLVQSESLKQHMCRSEAFIAPYVDCSGDVAPTWTLTGRGSVIELTPGGFAALRTSPEALAMEAFDSADSDVAFSGVAFGLGPQRSPLPGQQPIVGKHDGALDSYHGGDSTRGLVRVRLPPGTRRVAVLVGGGSDCDKTFVGLARGATVLARACGKDSEVLRPVLLTADDEDGTEPLEFIAVDDAAGAWQHLLADQLIALAAQADG